MLIHALAKSPCSSTSCFPAGAVSANQNRFKNIYHELGLDQPQPLPEGGYSTTRASDEKSTTTTPEPETTSRSEDYTTKSPSEYATLKQEEPTSAPTEEHPLGECSSSRLLTYRAGNIVQEKVPVHLEATVIDRR